MSRINKAFYVLDMVSMSGSIHKGSVLNGEISSVLKEGKLRRVLFIT